MLLWPDLARLDVKASHKAGWTAQEIDFVESLPNESTGFCKKFYDHLRRALNAKIAFEQMTSGRKAMRPSALLRSLAAEAYANPADSGAQRKPESRYANRSDERRDWEKWTDALQGLENNAKTLTRVSKQMKA